MCIRDSLKYLEDENKISFKAKSVADDNNSGCIRIAYLFFRQFFFRGKSIERVAPRRVCQYDLCAWFFTSEFPYSCLLYTSRAEGAVRGRFGYVLLETDSADAPPLVFYDERIIRSRTFTK